MLTHPQKMKGFSLGFFSEFGKEQLITHGNGKCILMDATAGACLRGL